VVGAAGDARPKPFEAPAILSKEKNMFDFLLSEQQIKIRDEARDLVKWVPRKMILDMDADKIKFPREFLQEAGRRNLRLSSIWPGTNEVMSAIVANEWYKE
jgi:alkylation response protein AidB-like acyl-CoA dehydrogenase